MNAIERELHERMRNFDTWKQKLVTSDNILGGEPVFPDSRLSVRRIGEMHQRDIPASEILEDYPYLAAEDLDFARLYITAYPRVGRPHAQASAR